MILSLAVLVVGFGCYDADRSVEVLSVQSGAMAVCDVAQSLSRMYAERPEDVWSSQRGSVAYTAAPGTVVYVIQESIVEAGWTVVYYRPDGGLVCVEVFSRYDQGVECQLLGQPNPLGLCNQPQRDLVRSTVSANRMLAQ
jgi:hypothetical protein